MRRRQLFYEVGSGKLAIEAQDMYEKIQQLALESKQGISMTIKIGVVPPAEGDRFGKTQYALTHTQPINKSIAFTTEYEAGIAMMDGESVESILQQSLFSNNIPENQR